MKDLIDSIWEALDRLLPALPAPWRGWVGLGVPLIVLSFGLVLLGRRAFPFGLWPISAERKVELQLLHGRISEGAARLLFERMAARDEGPTDPRLRERFVRAAVDIGRVGAEAERKALQKLARGEDEAAAQEFDTLLKDNAQRSIELLRRKAALFAPINAHAARDAYEQILALQEDDIDARYGLGHVLQRLGDLIGAERAYRRVLDQSGDSKSWRAAALHSLGTIAYANDNRVLATQLFTEALELDRAIGSISGIAVGLHALGDIAISSQEQLQYYKDAKTKYEIAKDKVGVAGVLGSIGSLFLPHRPEEAERYYKQALSEYEKQGVPRGIAVALSALADAQIVRGQLDSAAALLQRAEGIYRRLGDVAGITRVKGQSAQLEQRRGNSDQAAALLWERYHLALQAFGGNARTTRAARFELEGFYQQAYDTDEEPGGTEATANGMMLAAKTQQHRMNETFGECQSPTKAMNLKSAGEYYYRAYLLREKLQDKRGMAEALLGFSIVKRQSGEADIAQKTLAVALGNAQDASALPELCAIHTELGAVAESSGDRAQAIAQFELALRSAAAMNDSGEVVSVLQERMAALGR